MRPESPPRRPEELRVAIDPDFGAVKLVRTQSGLVYWEGRIGSVELVIHLYALDASNPPNVPDVPAPSRALLLRLIAEEAEIRREIATSLIDLAKNWAASGDLPEPTVESFAAGLRLHCVSTDAGDWRPTLWFEEPAGIDGIFAGHQVEACYEPDGGLIHYGLAG